MFRTFLAGVAGLALLTTAAPAAAGKMIAPPPVPLRVAQSDVVVLGKVTDIEDKAIKAERWPGDTQNGEFRVAVVKVNEALVGAKGLTHVKVGFVVGGGPGPRRGYGNPTLGKGQEVLLLLHRHHKESFLHARTYFEVLDKKSPNYAQEVAQARQAAKVLGDPMAGLKAKDPEQRLNTAVLLLGRYRTFLAGPTKNEPIGAEESKLILLALAGADWGNKPGRDFRMGPQNAFYQLGLEPTDGWMQPMDGLQFPAAAKAWLKANAGKYRVKRVVPAGQK